MEKTENLISISVNIAGRKYPVQVEQERINGIRELEKKLNDKLENYESEYPDLDRVDSLSLLLITYAFELEFRNNIQGSKLLAKLSALETMVDSVL